MIYMHRSTVTVLFWMLDVEGNQGFSSWILPKCILLSLDLLGIEDRFNLSLCQGYTDGNFLVGVIFFLIVKWNAALLQTTTGIRCNKRQFCCFFGKLIWLFVPFNPLVAYEQHLFQCSQYILQYFCIDIVFICTYFSIFCFI